MDPDFVYYEAMPMRAVLVAPRDEWEVWAADAVRHESRVIR